MLRTITLDAGHEPEHCLQWLKDTGYVARPGEWFTVHGKPNWRRKLHIASQREKYPLISINIEYASTCS